MRFNIISGVFCLLLSLMALSALALFLLLFLNLGSATAQAPLFAAYPVAGESPFMLSAPIVSPGASR